MIIEKSLEKFGLTEKEIRIYLAVLELGQDTVLNIAKKSEQKRPTVYITLELLTRKGLVRKIPKGTTTLYIAEDPNFLLNTLKEKEKSIRDIMPLLKAIHNTQKTKPRIKYYEGKDDVRKMYKELHQARKYILFYGSVKDIMKHFPDSFLNPERIKEMNIPVTEIVSPDPVDIKYAKRIQAVNNPKHKVRALKKGVSFVLDSVIFDDKLAIISLRGGFFGVMIENKDIAHSFRILYELAWQSAEKVK